MREPCSRVVQVRYFGGPDGLEVVDAPLPTAGRGEVRVRVFASGLEYTDVLIRRHLYPQTAARRPPFVLGYDVVDEIDKIGEGVRGDGGQRASPALARFSGFGSPATASLSPRSTRSTRPSSRQPSPAILRRCSTLQDLAVELRGLVLARCSTRIQALIVFPK